MIDILNWILVHPLASCIIAFFIMGIFRNIRFVEKTYNYYNGENEEYEEYENDED